MSAKLFLIPNLIAEDTIEKVIPAGMKTELTQLNHFLAEDIRTARRYFSSLKIFNSIEDLHFEVLNKQTKELELKKLMEPLLNGQSMGVVSESGCPGVADPGALAVKFAHQHNIQVAIFTSVFHT